MMATPYWEELKRAGLKYKIDPALLAAVMHQESGGNPRAKSPAGAMGLFQLMPGTAAALGVSDPFDPLQSIDGGARYLAEQLQRFGSVPLALAAYNAGPGAVQKYGGVPPYKETQGYVKAITAAYGRAGNASAAATSAPRSAEQPSTQPVAASNPQEAAQSVPQFDRRALGIGLMQAIRSRRGGDSGALRSFLGQVAAARQLQAASPQAAAAATSPGPVMPATPQATAPRSPSGVVASPASPAGSPLAGIAEAFYDPIGAYDEGKWISPIGGHSDHVHLSFSSPQKALEAIAVGQRMGLRVSENPYVDRVDPVHTKTSYHYRDFPGSYGGRQLGEALDASGAPATMAAFYKWATGRSR